MTRSIVKATGVLSLVALCLLAASPATAARNSEQVIFSGGGYGTFEGFDGPFGFWIWCEADSGNPYAGACSGAMYFPALRVTRGVKGFITEDEEQEGVYTMHVVSTRDDSIACELTNELPVVHGRKNTVHATCSEPTGTGFCMNSVVIVTGP